MSDVQRLIELAVERLDIASANYGRDDESRTAQAEAIGGAKWCLARARELLRRGDEHARD